MMKPSDDYIIVEIPIYMLHVHSDMDNFWDLEQ